jgi:hypothetical protein
MQTKVVHCNREPYDIYIGRPSEWGNPFIIGKDGTRMEVIDKYEKRMRGLLKKDPKLKKRFKLLRGKTLGCWCKPYKCHGDAIVKILNDLCSNNIKVRVKKCL